MPRRDRGRGKGSPTPIRFSDAEKAALKKRAKARTISEVVREGLTVAGYIPAEKVEEEEADESAPPERETKGRAR